MDDDVKKLIHYLVCAAQKEQTVRGSEIEERFSWHRHKISGILDEIVDFCVDQGIPNLVSIIVTGNGKPAKKYWEVMREKYDDVPCPDKQYDFWLVEKGKVFGFAIMFEFLDIFDFMDSH